MTKPMHKGQLSAPNVDAIPALLNQAGIPTTDISDIKGSVRVVAIESRFWGKAAEVAADNFIRWCAVWAEHCSPEILVTATLAGNDGHLLLCTTISDVHGELPSQTPYFSAANRPERHTQDMFGIRFTDHPDERRWIRHQAWDANQFPLRKEFPLAGTPLDQTPPDCTYEFVPAEGEGVYEIPVGPVHAGIIEPGHFRFSAMGEAILSLEEHLGYVHKGIEKCAEGRDVNGLARLAGRVSGDSTVTHAWAACQACENAVGLAIPPRAVTLRAILSERERIANHLGDIGACCNDVGFAFALVQFGRLRELWQRDSAAIFGHRFMMDVVIPGGVTHDINPEQIKQLHESVATLRKELQELLPLLSEYPSLQDRFHTTGILTPQMARTMSTLGYVARASNEAWDLRRDAPYAPYQDVKVKVPSCVEGDTASRVRVRGEELFVSLDLLDTFLSSLPVGKISVPFPSIKASCCGIGLVEGWRGETIAYVHLDENGIVSRYFPRDASWLNWPALEVLIGGEIVPDFPLCNKSVNGSYSGQDL
ncbi:MAG: NADH-quinone oxidoreductase subunit C [Alphaproteobacteria bacterium]|nr:NADH-quinone oxidoreductase subunit C [Alphaproteobacteria bacterium]